MAEPVRIIGHKRGAKDNEQLQAQVVDGIINALAVAPVDQLGIQVDPTLMKGEYNATPPTIADTETDALQLTSDGDLKTEIQNLSIEQVTGDAHNTYNICVAGKDGSDNVAPLMMTATGLAVAQSDAAELNVTEASASAIKTAVEVIDNMISGSRGLVTEDNSASIKTAVEAATQFASFQTSVTTAGTQVQLASHACRSATVKAKSTNTGLIYVGDLNVDSTTGFILSAGDSLSVDVNNTNLIWIDSSVNGEGVSVAYV